MAKRFNPTIYRYTAAGKKERCRKAEKGLPCKRHSRINPNKVDYAIKIIKTTKSATQTAIKITAITSAFALSLLAFNPITYAFFVGSIIAYSSNLLSKYLNKRRNTLHETELTNINQNLEDKLITAEQAQQLTLKAANLNIKRGKTARYAKGLSYLGAGLATTASYPVALAAGGLTAAVTFIAGVTASQGLSAAYYSYKTRNEGIYDETSESPLERRLTTAAKDVRKWTETGIQQLFKLNNNQTKQITDIAEEEILENEQQIITNENNYN